MGECCYYFYLACVDRYINENTAKVGVKHQSINQSINTMHINERINHNILLLSK